MKGRGREGRQRGALWVGAAAALVLACGDVTGDGIQPGPTENRVIVLHEAGASYRVMDLDGQGLPALSLRFALPAGFQGIAFDARGTVALSTTGGPGGNDLYVTDLASGATTVVPFPQPADDPGLPRFLSPDTAFIPARGTGLLYRFRVSAGALTPFTGAVAQSPWEVVPLGGRLYVLDANLDRVSGSPLGPSRVVVVDLASGLPVDTLTLTGEGPLRGAVAGGKVFVLEAGPATAPEGKLAVIDPGGGSPVLNRELDLQGVGVGLESGLDGRLYISVAPDSAAPDTLRVLVVDPVSEGFVAGPASPLALKRPDGADASCRSASADPSGALFCIERKAGAPGSLYTYDPDLRGRTAITLDSGPADLLVAAIP